MNIQETPSEDLLVALKEYAGEVSRILSREIESESRSFAVTRLQAFSENLDELAGSLSETAERFRERKSDSLAELLEACSEGLGSLSGKLKEDHVQGIISEVEGFARSRPIISIGAALAAGVLIWRLSSSRPGVRKTRGGSALFFEDTTAGKEEQSYERH